VVYQGVGRGKRSTPFCTLKTARRATLREVLTNHSREVVCGLGAVIALTVTIYVLISYLQTFAVKQLKLRYATLR
jgi:MHS family proline/betaine transporter-like MFS transporter